MCASRTTSFDRRSSLVRQASYVVSFVAADLASPAVGRLIAGMESHLWQRGHTLMISSREDLGNANGMVVIGDKKSLSTNVPATSIDLQGMVFEEPLTAEMSEWLKTKGCDAARAILRRIQSQNTRLLDGRSSRNRGIRAVRPAA
jgi:hypothetical protein